MELSDRDKLQIHYSELFPITEFQNFPKVDRKKVIMAYNKYFKGIDVAKPTLVVSPERIYRSVFLYMFASHPRIVSYLYRNAYYYVDVAFGSMPDYPSLHTLPKVDVFCSYIDVDGIKNKEYDTIFSRQVIPLQANAIHWLFVEGSYRNFQKDFPKTFLYYSSLKKSGGGNIIELPILFSTDSFYYTYNRSDNNNKADDSKEKDIEVTNDYHNNPQTEDRKEQEITKDKEEVETFKGVGLD